MRIAIATVQVPFIRGGAEILVDMLRDELKKRGHQVDVITIPFKWYPGETLVNCMMMGRMMDLTEVNGEKIDRVIAMKFPAYYVKHEKKVLWLMHQHRQAYDLWNTKYGDLQNFPDGETIRNFIVENDMALDIMPYVKKDEEFASDISQTNLNYWTTEEGELFTVSDVLSLSGGYWYNEDILHAAGVREIPRTWDAFRGMCYKIWKWSERENNEIASLQTSPEGYLYFMDHMLLEEGTEKDRNDVGTISEVLKRLQEIYVYSTSENAEYSYLDETRLFNEGKLAIYVNGVWGASLISENISRAEF